VRVGNGTKRPPPRRSGLLRRPLVALVALAAVGVLAAGCGSNGSGSGSGSGSGGYGSSGTAPASGGSSSVATVSASSTMLGMVLVDGSGRTLYLFEKDQPNQSACAGACAAAWPVDQSSGTPKAGSDATASLLGTIKRSDNTTQVTYNKHPLYYFSGDSGAGQQHGQGVDAFGAKWFAVTPAGGAVSGGATATTAANGGGYGSGGYGYGG
jgi:predicted lipoprotein with Yx(FWY)xxD motif